VHIGGSTFEESTTTSNEKGVTSENSFFIGFGVSYKETDMTLGVALG
jgi:hypothetical protein